MITLYNAYMMTETSGAMLKIFLTKPGAEGRVGQGQGGAEGPLSVCHKVERRVVDIELEIELDWKLYRMSRSHYVLEVELDKSQLSNLQTM